MLAAEFRGVRERRWNAERPLVFCAVVLQTTPGVRRARDIRRRVDRRLDLWEEGKFAGLVGDTVAEGHAAGGRGGAPKESSPGRAYNGKVLAGKLRSAVRGATDRGGGGVLFPDDVDTKTGRPVMEVLEGKHPHLRVPDLSDPECSAFEEYPELPEAIPMDFSEDDVTWVASKLSGSAGAAGPEAVEFRNWLLRFGAGSEALRVEMAEWANWLANTSPPWAAYRAIMACRLVALDKCPGVRPVGIGEIVRRLLAKMVVRVGGDQAKQACGSIQLCAGLEAGIEGAVHAVRERRERRTMAR